MAARFAFDASLLEEDCLTASPSVRLRRLALADAPAVAAGLNDLDVAKNLVAVPHPYGVTDAEEFLSGHARSPHMLGAAIEVEGAFAGCVAIDATAGAPELGYWLARSHWGKGVATLATRALVDLALSATAVPALSSGHFFDNPASAAILAKLGFRKRGVVEQRSRARGDVVRLVAMTLDRENWAARQPSIETRRMALRPPTMADAEEIARLANERGVALMTSAVPHPFAREDARGFVLATARQGRPATMSFTMRLRQGGAMVGGVGWKADGPATVELGYWLGAEHRGCGLATEAARAALEAAFRLTGASAARANCRVVNSASKGVLQRCGFQWEGTGLMRAAGGPGSIPVDRFRLDRDVFQSLRAWGPAAFPSGFA